MVLRLKNMPYQYTSRQLLMNKLVSFRAGTAVTETR
jgi:hypothetical protein